MKLTATSIRSLALAEGSTDRTIFDDDVPGFGVRVRAGGSRTYVVQYKIGGRHRRMPLGSTTAMDLSKARSTAKDLLAAVRLGHDPFGEKIEARAKVAETFGSLLPAYLVHKRSKLRPRTMVEIERHLMVNPGRFTLAPSRASTGAPLPPCLPRSRSPAVPSLRTVPAKACLRSSPGRCARVWSKQTRP
jgi:hypothetical protein